ncbi:MAG: phage integrase N-terminal SAM-like domain-containing protein [Desulfosporosinus sp.]
MQDFIRLMITSMELKDFAKNTQKTYLGPIRCFAEFCGKNPTPAGYDDVRAFLHHSITKRKLSLSLREFRLWSYQILFVSSALCREWNMLHVPRMKKKYSLPVILTPQEVFQIIKVTNNLKHKAILSTIYSAGLPSQRSCSSQSFRY